MKKFCLSFTLIIIFLCTFCFHIKAIITNPTLSIAFCNLTIQDNIYIKYAVSYENANDVKLLVFTSPQDEYVYGNHTDILEHTDKQVISGMNCFVFEYRKLGAKQMTDVVYTRAYTVIDGVYYYSGINKYSILQYAYNKLGYTGVATTNQSLIELLNNMLIYGASTQKYFNYKLDYLATDKYYKVTVVNGLLSDNLNHGLYKVNEEVEIYANAVNENGETFAYWKDSLGDKVSYDNVYKVKVSEQNETYTAVYKKYSNDLEFDSNGDGTSCLVSIGDCVDTDIVVPSEYNAEPITIIEAAAFSGESITSITIPETVEEIGRKAFYNCSSLTDVYFEGTQKQWEEVVISSNNDSLLNANIHFLDVDVCTVIFKDYDGSILNTQKVLYGNDAKTPKNPIRDGYVFDGWNGEYINVTDDIELIAQYSEQFNANQYSVKFIDYNGNIIKSEKVNKNESAMAPSNPIRKGYNFIGWDKDYNDVTTNLEVKAVYEIAKNQIFFEYIENDNNTLTLNVYLTGDVVLYGLEMKFDVLMTGLTLINEGYYDGASGMFDDGYFKFCYVSTSGENIYSEIKLFTLTFDCTTNARSMIFDLISYDAFDEVYENMQFEVCNNEYLK